MSYALIDEQNLTATANAIRAQLGTSDTYTPSEFAEAIASISGGGGSGSSSDEKDVMFIDYDGTILYSYTASEANALTELPANPSHAGLIAQGWNWTLAQIKSQLSDVGGKVWVGQMYVTESGNTEIDIELHEGRLSPYLGIAVNGTVVIDWGDGSSINTVTGTSLASQKRTNHTYSAAGNYTITISVTTGSFAFYGTSAYFVLNKNHATGDYNRIYANAVKAVKLGENVTIGAYAFYNCYSLTSIIIPSNVTIIGTYAFYNCGSLTSVTIPSNVTRINTYAFYNCGSLSSVTIPSNVTSIDTYAFYYCCSLTSITIPSNVTSIGSNVFSNCDSLTSITIPNNAISFSTSTFSGCRSLTSITIPSNVTSIGKNTFYNCYFLSSVTIPSNITSIDTYVFYNCYPLSSVTIPNKVTSIGNNAFYNCYSLSSITIPSNVTSIGSNAFLGCAGLNEIHLLPINPPTLSTNAFSNTPSDFVIYVPQNSLEAYKAASNWSTYASKMVGE